MYLILLGFATLICGTTGLLLAFDLIPPGPPIVETILWLALGWNCLWDFIAEYQQRKERRV